ncbi:glycosyltransferase family 2 protein [Streptomyces sp. NPDC048420]|uniref:glycosyltransferase family 2 protein n=1 Tax=Streptomyces sp. NPDC048420 TaxID=3155755 RepID=UPI00341D8289
MTTVVALMTCHNRREKTTGCLRSLRRQNAPGVSLRVVLIDDGSTDGTAGAAQEVWPGIHVVRGDGSLFWARGMAAAEAAASAYDFLLWLNDDVVLDDGALSRMLTTHRALAEVREEAIVVGAVRDPSSGVLTYSGVRRTSWLHPTRFAPVVPGDTPVPADTMHGNVVLVPRCVAARVGPIDGVFGHGMADFDYGLRARELGVRIRVAPGTLGTCARNSPNGSWRDPTLPIRQRLRLMRAPKGLPPRSWLRFTRRHAGPMWLMYWLSPYARILAGAVVTRIRHGARGVVR